MKRKLPKILFILLSAVFYYWTFLANLPTLGDWFTIVYGIIGILTVLFGIFSIFYSKKTGKWFPLFTVLLFVPFFVGAATILYAIGKLIYMAIVTFFSLLFSH